VEGVHHVLTLAEHYFVPRLFSHCRITHFTNCRAGRAKAGSPFRYPVVPLPHDKG
jgi:hypothetical protein